MTDEREDNYDEDMMRRISKRILIQRMNLLIIYARKESTFKKMEELSFTQRITKEHWIEFNKIIQLWKEQSDKLYKSYQEVNEYILKGKEIPKTSSTIFKKSLKHQIDGKSLTENEIKFKEHCDKDFSPKDWLKKLKIKED